MFEVQQPHPAKRITVSQLVAQLKPLVSRNCHGDALQLAANAFGLSDLALQLESVNRKHLEKGYLTPELDYQRSRLRQQLRAHVQKQLGEAFGEIARFI